jgi:SpoVK/Ycf46/Vps4 family AAA+-type ATPase
LQSLFREAEIHNAVLFFDECESMFAQRGHGGSSQMSMMLTEIEKHTGIIFLATNRPFDLDEAMHRRITASFEFRPPNHIERAAIWRIHTAEAGVPMRDDVDWKEIAVRYELAGGYADLRRPSVLRPNPAICCSMKEGCV